jgi:hypothetical protein
MLLAKGILQDLSRLCHPNNSTGGVTWALWTLKHKRHDVAVYYCSWLLQVLFRAWVESTGHAARQTSCRTSTLPVNTKQNRALLGPLWTEAQTPRMLPCSNITVFMVGLAQGMRKLIHWACCSPKGILPGDLNLACEHLTVMQRTLRARHVD